MAESGARLMFDFIADALHKGAMLYFAFLKQTGNWGQGMAFFFFFKIYRVPFPTENSVHLE